MFVHSVKVPRLYKVASKIAQKVAESGASVKQLVYEQIHYNIQALYALVVGVLKNSNKLDYLIRTTQILFKENRLDPWLTRVLITELLWGKQQLPTSAKPVQTILKYREEFNKALENYTDDSEPVHENKKVNKPRYVRVNTLKISVHEVISIFRDEGWTLLRYGDNSDYGVFLATAASLSDDQFIVDIHIHDLLVFPPNTQFHQHPLYKNNEIILQDKASCLPPFLLAPEAGSIVLDMCAAPGMKTSQLAAMVKEEGKVFAIERDQRRYEILCKLTDGIGATNVTCINKDVMTMTNKDIPDIQYILVDPSCSGSGMVDRLNFESSESKCNKSRLQSLAGFQITILRHALSNFPKVKRVIYSTCSVYPEENEEVIQQVLSSVPNFKIVSLREKLQSKWLNFGSNDFGDIGTFSLYTKSEEDLTNGFFVTLFERCEDGEKNPHFVKRVKRSSECQNEEKHIKSDDEAMESEKLVLNDSDENNTDVNVEKKRKKKKNKLMINEEMVTVDEDPKPKKVKNSVENNGNEHTKKKSKKHKLNMIEEMVTADENPEQEKKKSKKHKLNINEENSNQKEVDNSAENEHTKKKSKKKNKSNDNSEITEKNSKKNKSTENEIESIETDNISVEDSNKKVKKKCKKSKSKENPSDDIKLKKTKSKENQISTDSVENVAKKTKKQRKNSLTQ